MFDAPLPPRFLPRPLSFERNRCVSLWGGEITLTESRYEQLTLKANALREELHTEVERMLNDIIKFKVHIQKSLEDYEGFVVEEAEQELAGGDEMEDEQLVEE